MTQHPTGEYEHASGFASEQGIRLLADAMPQLVWSARPDGSVDYYNQRYKAYDGIREVNGIWTWEPVLHPDDLQPTIDAYRHALETGMIYEIEHRIHMADGSLRWHLSRGVPIRDANGKIIRWFGTATDIHRQKLAELELAESEARYRSTFENAAVGIAHVGLDGRLLNVNNRFCEITGYMKEELLQKTFLDITHPDDQPYDRESFQRAIDGEIPSYQIDKRYVRKDGSPIWVTRTASLEYNAEGKPSHFISIVQDIDTRKRLEEQDRFLIDIGNQMAGINNDDQAVALALPKLCAFLRVDRCLLAETSPDGSDLQLRVFRADRQEEAPLIEHHPEFTAPLLFELEAGVQVVVSDTETDLRTRQENVEIQRKHPVRAFVLTPGIRDGLWLGTLEVLSAQPRTWLPEELLLLQSVNNLLWLTIDKTRLFDSLQEYTHKLERSNKDLADFAFMASHDLQEPLRKVKSFGERLREGHSAGLSDEGRDYLERMIHAATRMSKMIDDLLAYSRVSTKAMPFTRVDLKETMRDVLSDLEVRIEQSNGKVEIGALPVVKADAVQMQQLFQNLVNNALKFHAPETAPVVQIDSQMLPEGQVEIRVADNGIGFDTQYLDRIFQPFQRLHGRSEFEGSGMGLAICQKIVERHGGTLTAESAPGKGSAFFIRLPGRALS